MSFLLVFVGLAHFRSPFGSFKFTLVLFWLVFGLFCFVLHRFGLVCVTF